MNKPSSFSLSSVASGVPTARDFGESCTLSAVAREDRFLERRPISSATTASEDAREATLSFRRTLSLLLRLLNLRGCFTPFVANRRSLSLLTSAPFAGIVRLLRLLAMLSFLLCSTGTARSAVLILRGREAKSSDCPKPPL